LDATKQGYAESNSNLSQLANLMKFLRRTHTTYANRFELFDKAIDGKYTASSLTEKLLITFS